MAILDTSIIIDKLKNNEQISDNITEVSVIEYPPILSYAKFSGKDIFDPKEGYPTCP